MTARGAALQAVGVAGLASLLLLPAACSRQPRPCPGEGAGAAAWQTDPAKPLRVRPAVPEVSLCRPPEAVDRLTKRMWPGRKADFRDVLHALRVFEPGAASPSA